MGTPTVPSTSSFSITVTDSSSPAQTATQSIPNFVVSTGTLALNCFIDIDNARLGVPYNEGCSASGGTAPPTYSISSGILPRGLIFNPASGVLKGIPLVSGPFPIIVKAVDSALSPVSVSRTISDFVILPYKPLFLACDVPLFQTVGVPFMGFATGFCGASFGIAPYTYPISSGTAPPGLSIDPSGGQFVGTLTTAGIYSFTVKAIDSGSPPSFTTTSVNHMVVSPYPSQTGTITVTATSGGIVNTTTIPVTVP